MSNLTELFAEFDFDPVMVERITELLGSDNSVKLLRQSVVGRSIESATKFFNEILHLQPLDASALAGQLVLTGNYISISHLIIPSRFEIVSIISLISFLHRAVCFEITLYLLSLISFLLLVFCFS